MALITNRGKLINDLPLSPTIADDDSLIIQKSADKENRTEQVKFFRIKDYILNKAKEDLTTVGVSVDFFVNSNKFTGSFFSPTPTSELPNGGFANFYKVKIRDSLDLAGGDLSANNLYINNIDVAGTINGSILGVGSATVGTLISNGNSYLYNQLTTDNIDNALDIKTDSLIVNTVAYIPLIQTTNIGVNNTVSAQNLYGTVISGSHSGSLLSKNTKATGSFYGIFKGSEVDVRSGIVHTNTLRVYGSSIFAQNADVYAKRFTVDDGFYGDLYGNLIDPGNGKICTSVNGIDFSPPFTSQVSKFYGTASYCLKSEQTDNLIGEIDQANTSSYVTWIVGTNNGTVYNSVRSDKADILSSMCMFTSSILLESSLTSPAYNQEWIQLPSINQHPSALSSPGPLLTSPLTGSFGTEYYWVNMKPTLDMISSSFTGYLPKYMLIRARLEGKANLPNGSTTSYTISEPHHAKLAMYPNETGIYDDYVIDNIVNPLRKQVVIPFQRNAYTPSCCSETNTFLLSVPLVDGNNEQALYYTAFISSSAGREITPKANAQFSWSFKIYLDGVL